MSVFRRQFHGLAWLVVLTCLGGAGALANPAVDIVGIDGGKSRGTWVGITNGQVVIQEDDKEVAHDLDDLMVLEFAVSTSTNNTQSPADDLALADSAAVVHLADGGVLTGELLPGAGDRIALRTSLTGELAIPFDQLAGVRIASPQAFPTSRELFEEALAARLPGQDVMVTRGIDDVKALRGRLVKLDPDGGAFVFADRERSFQPHRLFGIVFAAGVGKGEPLPLFVSLSDGTSFGAEPLSADAYQMKLRMVGGTVVDIPLLRVTRVDVRSRRLSYVSDLTPTEQVTTGRLHRPTSIRYDRAISGGAITLGGVAYPRGLAMSSRTEVSFDLHGEYEAFAATVGIDDAVRPYGAVNLRVLGDGKTLLDTGTLTGLDEPRDVSVPVDGVQQLTLITDFGDGVDVADHADWALARLLKKVDRADKRPVSAPKDGD